MTTFHKNPHRVDPYKNFKFRIKWDGRYVAGASKVSGFNHARDVVKHRDGGDNSTDHKSPGRTSYDAVTLERGVTHDPDFEQWASRVWTAASRPDANSDLEKLRSNITIELLDEAGHVAQTYELLGCWVSEYQALPDLDADANATAIQLIRLEHEGWSRPPAQATRSTDGQT